MINEEDFEELKWVFWEATDADLRSSEDVDAFLHGLLKLICPPKPVIKFRKKHADIEAPGYAYPSDSGADLKADSAHIIEPGQRAVVSTGLEIELPEGYELQIRPRSGLAAKNGITVLNTPGTIDTAFRGEIKVILQNHGPVPHHVYVGDKIAQAVIARVEQAEYVEVEGALSETERGEGGLGSTGK